MYHVSGKFDDKGYTEFSEGSEPYLEYQRRLHNQSSKQCVQAAPWRMSRSFLGGWDKKSICVQLSHMKDMKKSMTRLGEQEIN